MAEALVFRQLFYDQHGVHPPDVNPGGWSCHGQPVDQLHSMFRAGIARLDMASTGQTRNLRKRARSFLEK